LPLYAGLVGFAVAWYYAAPLIVLGSIIAGPFVLLWWLERPGHHRAAFWLAVILHGVIDGLFNRRRGRRRW
jgi:hypothetical protein